MKLLTKKLIKRFKEVGSQKRKKDPIVIAKYYNPKGVAVWYATAYNPETKTFYGYVARNGDWNDKWEHFSLNDLLSYQERFALVREMYCGEFPISDVFSRFENLYRSISY